MSEPREARQPFRTTHARAIAGWVASGDWTTTDAPPAPGLAGPA